MPPDPTILAFDTSAAHCAAALLIRGKIAAYAHEDMARGQAERLFSMLSEVLGQEGAVWEEVDAIAVGIGPGNFTGTRIAVSAARGLALSLSKPSVGVSTFDALRWAGRLADNPSPLIVSLPASRRGKDVLLQYYQDADPQGDPVELAIFGEGELDKSFEGFPQQAHVLGHEAASVDVCLNKGAGDFSYLEFSPKFPLVEQVAHVAANRLLDGQDVPRPSPLYIRPADAAPASDPPPVILP